MENFNNYPNLYNLLTVIHVTDKPILVEDVDLGETYDITNLIREAAKEVGLG